MATKYTIDSIKKNVGTLTNTIPSEYQMGSYNSDVYMPADAQTSLTFSSQALICLSCVVDNGTSEDEEIRYYWQQVNSGDSFSGSGFDKSTQTCKIYIPYDENNNHEDLKGAIRIWNRQNFSCEILPFNKFIFFNHWNEENPSTDIYPIMKTNCNGEYYYFYRQTNTEVPSIDDNHTALLMPINTAFREKNILIKDAVFYPIQNTTIVDSFPEPDNDYGYNEYTPTQPNNYILPFSTYGLSPIEELKYITNIGYYTANTAFYYEASIMTNRFFGKQALASQLDGNYRKNPVGALKENLNFANVTDDWFALKRNRKLFVNNFNGNEIDKLTFSSNCVKYDGKIIFNAPSWFGNNYIIDKIVVGRKETKWKIDFTNKKSLKFESSTSGDYQFPAFSYNQDSTSTIDNSSITTVTSGAISFSIIKNNNLSTIPVINESHSNAEDYYNYATISDVKGNWGPLAITNYFAPNLPYYYAWLYSNDSSIDTILNSDGPAFTRTKSAINPAYENQQDVQVTIRNQYIDWNYYNIDSSVNDKTLSSLIPVKFQKNTGLASLNTSKWLENNIKQMNLTDTTNNNRSQSGFTQEKDDYFSCKTYCANTFKPFNVTCSIVADYIPDITDYSVSTRCNATSCSANYCYTAVDQFGLNQNQEGNFYYQWLDISSDFINLQGPALFVKEETVNNNSEYYQSLSMMNSTNDKQYNFGITYRARNVNDTNSLSGANFIRFNLPKDGCLSHTYSTSNKRDEYSVAPLYWSSESTGNFQIKTTAAPSDEAVVFIHLHKKS